MFDGGDGATYEANPAAGCGQKLQSACTSFFLGIVLFPLSLYLLGWNERNFVCTQKQIYFAEANAEEWPCDTTTTLPEDELYHFSCPFDPNSYNPYSAGTNFNPELLIINPGLGAFFNNLSFSSLGGSQSAYIYTCIETEHKETVGRGDQRHDVTTYTYAMGWARSPSAFHMVLEGTNWANAEAACGGEGWTQGQPSYPLGVNTGMNTQHADTVTASNISLPDAWIDQIPIDTTVTPSLLSGAHPITGAGSTHTTTDVLTGATATWRIGTDSLTTGATLTDCLSDTHPTFGCVKLQYRSTSATQASVIAVIGGGKQAGTETTPASWLCPEDSYYAFYPRTIAMTLTQVIEAEHASNSLVTWVIRICGLLMAWMSVFCCFAPVAFAADILGDCLNFIPCLGGFLEDIVEGFVNAVLCCISCAIGCSSGLCVIATVMLIMRPLWGCLLFLVIGCILAGSAAVSHHAPRKQRKGDEEVELMENES